MPQQWQAVGNNVCVWKQQLTFVDYVKQIKSLKKQFKDSALGDNWELKAETGKQIQKTIFRNLTF